MGEMTSGRHALAPALEYVAREIRALSLERDPAKATWAPLRRAILAVADPLREEAGAVKAPVRLPRLAGARQIHNIAFFATTRSPEAVLVPIERGFLVRLRPGVSEHRARFSLAHEIGHTFFYDLSASPPRRLLGMQHNVLRDRKKEDICNAFARELLIPRALVAAVRRVLHSRKGSLAELGDLARRFEVSVEHAAIRMLWDLDGFETAVALFHVLSDPRVRELDPKIEMRRPRRYWGKEIRARSTVWQREIIDSVTSAVAQGDLNMLADVSAQADPRAVLRWRTREDRGMLFTTAVLGFPRQLEPELLSEQIAGLQEKGSTAKPSP